MADVVRAIFKIVRNEEANLPVLQEGELGYAIDKNVLFIGDPDDGNVAINKDVVTNESLEAKGYLVADDISELVTNETVAALDERVVALEEKEVAVPADLELLATKTALEAAVARIADLEAANATLLERLEAVEEAIAKVSDLEDADDALDARITEVSDRLTATETDVVGLKALEDRVEALEQQQP